MKALIQRVKRASVTIDGELYSAIGKGLLVFVGVEKSDDKVNAEKLAEKILKLRIFEDENEKMNLSVTDVQGEILIVSQFTLCATFKSGNRPGFDPAMPPAQAKKLYELTVDYAKSILPGKIATGIFGSDMQVSLINDGPCTFMLEF